MRLFRGMWYALVITLFLAGCVLIAWQSASGATVAAHRFTCGYFGYCPFTGANLTGPGLFIPRDGHENHVLRFADPAGNPPGSVRNHSGDDLWLLDRQTSVYACILPGDAFNTGGNYGYAEMYGGHTSCTESHPANLT